ncbi:MAG: transcription-repair coupling factor [Nitrospirae bacterium]|nr:transcription-repair coupling factor [Nitrospirota bacterium]
MISVSDIKAFLSVPAGVSALYNLAGSSAALLLSLQEKPYLAVERTEDAAQKLCDDVKFFLSLFPGPERRIHFLAEPNGPETAGRRAQVIHELSEGDSVITSAAGLSAPVWYPRKLEENSLSVAPGKEIERDLLERRLRNLGYRRVSIVMEQGEYTAKGWLVDIFPSTAEYPLRIEFFGDEIEEIRSFDIDSQRSMAAVDNVRIMPAAEPSEGSGIASLIAARLFFIDSRPDVYPPAQLAGERGEAFGGRTAVADDGTFLSRLDFKGEGHAAGLLPLRGLGILPDERKSLEEVPHVLSLLAKEHFVRIVSSSEGQAERVKEILFDRGVIAPIVGVQEMMSYGGAVAITKGRLSSGLFMPGLLILTEKEIFGDRPGFRPLRKSKISHLLTSIDDIAPGDLVVHRDHGIGRFTGLQREGAGEAENDLIVLEYAGADRLYIPLYNIDRIKKYGAGEGVAPALDKLGGKTWQRRRERVRKAVKEMAEKLLALYAEREVTNSFAFSPDTELHREFYGFFPYEETPDQIKAFEEISRDMESEKPMERLLCGDVGYGKTEVAMRAAFKAIYDGKQVAVLVPTTILCEQHYLTFRSRFAGFPVKIDYLSRFKSKHEQALTLKALARGEADVAIGTHGLLRKDISFSDLGLLIIDEEHRFGVAQKEKIKELRKGVDVLSMTATPIPRTLHMALSGIRGMSIIETPPEERLAVRSMVAVFDEGLIREAIERELRRNGQVLFVHNTVFDIEKSADLLKRLLPDARFAVAHGQMPEKRLEEVMLKFMRGETDVLVSTTIIGSGIDIPTANTIMIDRADKIGLSDLYQLRGRVGRSSVRAYAYFLIPGTDLISDEAKKRLQAIREMSYLGAGFRLAMKDLEMRGAGNLLGAEQSGHIHAVGFDLYVEMIEKAVAELKGAEVREEMEPSIALKTGALIPETYVEDMTLRLSMYRRIANAKSAGDLEDLESEMSDRFGSLPREARNLLAVMRLKMAAKALLITRISEADGKVRVVFAEGTPVRPETMLGLRKILHGVRFREDGFELDIRGLSKEDVQGELQRALSALSA